jgi:formylglycine-generating enzyme required for sulfatase activity
VVYLAQKTGDGAMRSKRVWLLLVSLVLVCGLIGCGRKPEPVVAKPDAVFDEPTPPVVEESEPAVAEPKAGAEEVNKPDVIEEPKAPIQEFAAEQKECSQRLGLPVEITNSIGMKLRLIPAGEFMMGSPASDSSASRTEKPQHKGRITKPFYLGMYEVTQAEYEKVMGENPSKDKGATKPVEMVSWDDAAEFCKKLSAKEGKTYRLPTEAEWEYACRAGTTTRYSFGDDEESLGEYAWYQDNSNVKTHPVGEKKPNAWGLHDMLGNVSEWCAAARSERTTDRVVRGGCLGSFAGGCRAACRGRFEPQVRFFYLGFRVAAVPPGGPSQEPENKQAEPGA